MLNFELWLLFNNLSNNSFVHQ